MTFTGCNDVDDNGLKTQDHDANEMMSIMHEMSAKMDAMTMTGDADHDFATMMKMHHQGAIDIGNKRTWKVDDATIKSTAQMMINMQQAEILELQSFIDSHTPESFEEGGMWSTEAMEPIDRFFGASQSKVDDFSQLISDNNQV